MELEEMGIEVGGGGGGIVVGGIDHGGCRCRTCLYASPKGIGFTQVSQLCFPDKSVKEVLIEMVPQMERTLSDEDKICKSCLKTVIAYAKFISRCMEIEVQLTQDDEEEVVEKEEDGDERQDGEEWNEEDEDVQVVENIEIVVENDLDKPLDHDHVYIKSETDEGAVEILKLDHSGAITGKHEKDASYDGYESNNTMDHDMDDDDEASEGLEHIQIQKGQVLRIKEELHDDENSSMEVYMDMDPECSMCDTCGKLIKDKEMAKHLETHEHIIYQCSECDKGFKSKQLLKNHISCVHEPDIVGFRYQCTACDKLFKNRGGLNSHYKLMHLNYSPFKCQICSQTFGRADYLKKHLQTHEERERKSSRTTPGKFLRFKNTCKAISEDPLPCKICGKVYNGINKLKVHLQTHVVVKRYQCEFCNLTYKRWPSLKRHEKTHLEADEYFHRCNVCWKRLKTEEELKMHMASHGNPKYQCHICDEQFHRKYLFDNHYLLQHATPEDLENSKKEIIYDTLLELSTKID